MASALAELARRDERASDMAGLALDTLVPERDLERLTQHSVQRFCWYELPVRFQNNHDDQLFAADVFRDVSFGPLNLGLPEEQVRARVEDALAVLSIEDLADFLTRIDDVPAEACLPTARGPLRIAVHPDPATGAIEWDVLADPEGNEFCVFAPDRHDAPQP